MKILLIGANSYLGARVFFDLKTSHTLTGTYASHPLSDTFRHLDITNPDELASVVSETNPDCIIHSANNASASWCEANPEKATAINETATRSIAAIAKEKHILLFYVSSMSAADTPNMYGKMKIASEQIIKEISPDYVILRPSLILGFSPNTTNDRPFNRILKNLDENTPAVYDSSWRFQPTYIRHISEVISECINRKIVNVTIPISVPELTSRFQSAYDILSPFGIEVLPVDSKDKTFTDYKEPLKELDEFKLQKYSYKQMIQLIVEEITNRQTFRI